jgi:hypothetical protein
MESFASDVDLARVVLNRLGTAPRTGKQQTDSNRPRARSSARRGRTQCFGARLERRERV